MTKIECGALMATIRAAYPKFYAFDDANSKRAAMNLWAHMMADVPYQAAEKSVLNHIATHSDPPTIADILKPLAVSKNPEEGWAEIKAAARKADRYAQWRKYPAIVGWNVETNSPIKSDGTQELKELFDSLSPDAKDFVGSPDRLLDMGRNGVDEYQHSAFVRIAAARADEQPSIEIEAVRTSLHCDGHVKLTGSKRNEQV